MGANMAVLIVGYDVTSASGPDKPSLLERIKAGEFGEPYAEFDGTPASVSEWAYWQGKAIGFMLGGWTGGGDSNQTCILGKKVAETYDCRLEPDSVGPVPLESLARVAGMVADELRKIGVEATPELHILWSWDS